MYQPLHVNNILGVYEKENKLGIYVDLKYVLVLLIIK